MMSLESIQSLQQDAHKEAADEGKVPYPVEAEDIKAWKAGLSLPLPFPFIGDYVPPGYEECGDALFVDHSGFGEQGEAALTLAEFLEAVEPGKSYALTEVSQFQSYVQAFVTIKRPTRQNGEAHA